MNKRISILIAMGIVVVGLILHSILSNQKTPMQRRNGAQTSRPVPVQSVVNSTVRTRFEVTGHLTALNKVELFAEVSGVLLLTPKQFREGNRFEQGSVLIHVDESVYRNNVLAQKSSLLNQITLLLPDLSIDFPKSAQNWESYLQQFELEQPLQPLPEVSSDQERYYVASRNIYSQFYQIKSMEETLAKYTIEAPFDGVVSSSLINPGTLVRQGQKLGEFTSTAEYELAAAVSINRIPQIRTGDTVTLLSEDIPGTFSGKIQRINEVLDRASQTVMVYITTQDPRLRDGMYLTARLQSQPIENAFRVPRNLIIEGTVFIVTNDSTLQLTPVDIVDKENGIVVVQGLRDGTLLVNQPLATSREGSKVNVVQVSDKTQWSRHEEPR